MRIGATLVRGTRRALMRMALSAGALALGAVEAGAQLTVTAPGNVAEGGRAAVRVSATVAAGAAASTIEVRVSAAGRSGVAAPLTMGEPEDSGGFSPADPAAPGQGLLTLAVPANGGAAAVTRTLTGEIVWQTDSDPDAEDEAFDLTVTVDAMGNTGRNGAAIEAPAAPLPITIDDGDSQRIVLALNPSSPAPREGTTFNARLRASPTPVDLTHAVTLAIDDSAYALGVTATTLDADNPSRSIPVTAPANDGNRTNDTVVLKGFRTGTVIEVTAAPLRVEVADAHRLPAVTLTVVDGAGNPLAPQPRSVREGETVRVRLTAVDEDGTAAPATEPLSVSLTPTGAADAQDYTLADPIAIAVGAASSAPADLVVAANDDVNDETLAFDATVSGRGVGSDGRSFGRETRASTGVLSLTIEDTTQKLVEARPAAVVKKAIDDAMAAGGGADGLNPGESFQIAPADLFCRPGAAACRDITAADGIAYSVSSTDPAVAALSTRPDGAVTVAAGGVGTAEVAVTARFRRCRSSPNSCWPPCWASVRIGTVVGGGSEAGCEPAAAFTTRRRMDVLPRGVRPCLPLSSSPPRVPAGRCVSRSWRVARWRARHLCAG